MYTICQELNIVLGPISSFMAMQRWMMKMMTRQTETMTFISRTRSLLHPIPHRRGTRWTIKPLISQFVHRLGGRQVAFSRNSAFPGTRTRVVRITSPTLYRLSYRAPYLLVLYCFKQTLFYITRSSYIQIDLFSQTCHRIVEIILIRNLQDVGSNRTRKVLYRPKQTFLFLPMVNICNFHTQNT